MALARPLAPTTIILGLCDDELSSVMAPSLRLGILLGKAYIWQCRNVGVVPVESGFVTFVERHAEVELFVAESTGSNIF